MGDDSSWARVVLVAADDTQWEMTLVGEGSPDLSVIDRLARLQFAVRRHGGRMRLQDVSPVLSGLLDLAGLLGEVGGEAECREDSVHVEEGVDRRDTSS